MPIKSKTKDKEQLCQMGGQGSGPWQGRTPAAQERVPELAEPTLLLCSSFPQSSAVLSAP